MRALDFPTSGLVPEVKLRPLTCLVCLGILESQVDQIHRFATYLHGLSTAPLFLSHAYLLAHFSSVSRTHTLQRGFTKSEVVGRSVSLPASHLMIILGHIPCPHSADW